MCLTIDKKYTNQDKKLLKKNDIVYYKIYEFKVNNNKITLTSKVMSSEVKIVNGQVISNRAGTKISEFEKRTNEIHHGIHVYKDRLVYCGNDEVIIPVTGTLENFVASNDRQAVFYAVEVNKKTIIKAVKEKLETNEYSSLDEEIEDVGSDIEYNNDEISCVNDEMKRHKQDLKDAKTYLKDLNKELTAYNRKLKQLKAKQAKYRENNKNKLII